VKGKMKRREVLKPRHKNWNPAGNSRVTQLEY